MHKTSCGSALPLPPLSHHSERVEGRAGHHPGLPQARRKAGQAPPPQQLPKVVGVAREAEEACEGGSYNQPSPLYLESAGGRVVACST